MSYGATAARSSNFYLGFLFLPKERREALSAVYGFCRMIDDIVDSGNLTPEESKKLLDFWRAEVDRLFDGQPGHSISQALLPHVRRFALPKQPFLDLITGCELDLTVKRYATFEELEKYLYGVAVTVGLLCVEIFGHKHTSEEDLREYARNMGYAFQLTNILRDVGTDLEQGRVYLPQDALAAAGCTMEDLILRRHTPAFRTAMKGLYDRAGTHYRRARNLLHPADRPFMVPAEVMARNYEGVLEVIRENDFRVFFQRASLSPWRKLRLAASAWAYSYGWV